MKIFHVLLLLFLPLFTGCNKLELQSQFKKNDIVIDGKKKDWAGHLVFLEKEKISLGIMNDDTDLYLSLSTNDHELIRQIMAQGFILWLDRTGKKKKNYGLRFPLGIMNSEMKFANRSRYGKSDERQGFSQKTGNEMEIIGKDREVLRKFNLDSMSEFEAKLNLDFGMLHYELKIPLQKKNDFSIGIGSAAGELISLGFETQKFDRAAMREKMGGGRLDGSRGVRPGGIRGGRPGGRGGGKQGGMGGGQPGAGQRPQMPEQFKLWAAVQLSNSVLQGDEQ